MDRKNEISKRIVAVIPARMSSSRFPGKPLAPILGLPMIEHVRRRAALAKNLKEVYVATCDQEIGDAVISYGGKVLMTSSHHERCTDRVKEAIESLDIDKVVIISGDEPLFMPQMADSLIESLMHPSSIFVSNLLSHLSQESDVLNPDIVKVVTDQNKNILYFSRASIPYPRVPYPCAVYRQTGFSAFTKEFLIRYSHLKPTPFEITESIDFMRILEHGFAMKGIIDTHETIGVDRPEDILKVEKVLESNAIQKQLYLETLSL